MAGLVAMPLIAQLAMLEDGWRAGWLNWSGLTTFNSQARSKAGTGRARGDRQAGYRADGSQGLASEPQGGNAEKVLGAAQLAGGVPHNRQR
jgi:hypothetical protein